MCSWLVGCGIMPYCIIHVFCTTGMLQELWMLAYAAWACMYACMVCTHAGTSAVAKLLWTVPRQL